MMSLLNVTVIRGKIAGSDQQQKTNANEQHNTFLVLKLENVKSSTVPHKGVDPNWDEDFLFETSKTTGVDLLVELWQKGLIWDNVIGYKLIQVDQLFQGQLAAPEFNGGHRSSSVRFHAKRWFTLDADLLVSGVDQPTIIGTKNSTPYMVLLELRWELTSHAADSMMGRVDQPYEPHNNTVDNYNQLDTYDSYGSYGSGACIDAPYPQQYNCSETYSLTGYNGLIDGDAAAAAAAENGDNRSYLIENCYGDNNYSFYDNAYQQNQSSSCDMTKRPKLLPQVPATTMFTDMMNHQPLQPSSQGSTFINASCEPPGFSFEVFGTHPDAYLTSDCSVPYDVASEYDYEYEVAPPPTRTRRKVLPSAPLPVSQFDEFENEPLSYNSQPPAKFENRYYGDSAYDYGVESELGVMNHVDQLNWKNIGEDDYYDEMAGDHCTPPPPRSSSKRKVLPQIPVQSKYGTTKSLPATPAVSALGINGKSRKLPHPVTNIPISTTSTGFTHDYDYMTARPQFKSSVSADAAEIPDDSSMFYSQLPIAQDSAKGSNLRSPGKPSLLADMKSLFSKTSSSILPAMSSTLNNVSSSLTASLPTAHVMQPNRAPFSSSSSGVNETELSYDFMKSNKFEEASGVNHGGSMPHTDVNALYYDDSENQLNNNFNVGDVDEHQIMDGYDSVMSTTQKMLPSVPVQQVPFIAAANSSTSQARNFFQSKANTTFHTTVENMSEEDPQSSSALNQSNGLKMSTNNSYELEDMSVDKSLYGSSFHTDIDEYDLIANGDIKQNFSYTEKNLMAAPVPSSLAELGGAGPLKTDAKPKLSHSMFQDNDAVNNNHASRTAAHYDSKGGEFGVVDEYGYNGSPGAYGSRSLGATGEMHDYEGSQYHHNLHAELYYEDQDHVHQGGEDDQYYDSYSNQRLVPTTSSAMGQDLNAAEYYYSQVEMGTGINSNLEGIEELDEYERDEKEAELEENAPYDYKYYKDSLKSSDRDQFIEEEEEEDSRTATGGDGELNHELSSEFVHDHEDSKGDDLSKHWTPSDDEIIETESAASRSKKTALAPTATTSVISEALAPNPLSGISALMTSMSPAVVTQSSLSPGSMLAAGITTTLAANISNTITTTITGSPSIIFDASATGGENEPGSSTISKSMGAVASGEGAMKMTAKQRWHHAYNKIIMQLNVSTFSCFSQRSAWVSQYSSHATLCNINSSAPQVYMFSSRISRMSPRIGKE